MDVSHVSLKGSLDEQMLHYPRSVQTEDGRIYGFGHIGSDNAYGSVDQAIVMDTFRLTEAGAGDDGAG
jgi:hypothetical protein